MTYKSKKRFFIVFSLMFFLCTLTLNFGCAADIPDEIKVSENTIQTEETTIAEVQNAQQETVLEPTVASPIDTFDYKMTLLNRNIDEETSMITDVYIIEFLSCEYSAATFVLLDSNYSEIESTYSNVTVEKNNCRICEYSEDEFSEHLNSASLLDSRDLFVITLSYQRQEPIENIIVQTTIMNREKGLSKDATLMANANIEEITTNPKYIHGNALVKLDSKYYIFAQNGYGGCEHPMGKFSMCNLIPLTKEEGTIEEQLAGKFEFVDINGEEITCPKGYEIYFKTSENAYDIGIVATDVETEMPEEIAKLAQTTYLKYTDKDKNSIILFSK